MGVNGKGTFVPFTRRHLFQGVKLHVVGMKGNVIESVFNTTDIDYMDGDRRDGSVIVFMRAGGSVHVTDPMVAAANQWGQRENVVKYKRLHDDSDLLLEVTLRVDDVTAIEVSMHDMTTVLVKAPFGVFPVVGKHESIVERTSYCRPFATFTKVTRNGNVPTAIPIDTILGVESSHVNNQTLVRTDIGRMPIVESVDESMEIIDREADAFNEALESLKNGS